MKVFLPLLALLLLFSCSKKKTQPQPVACQNYETGVVLAQLNDTAKIEDAFALFDSLQRPITLMVGFLYASPYPADSIPALKALLNAKPYINNGQGYTVIIFPDSLGSGVVTIRPYFYEMNLANQQDWINTKKTLGLTELPTIDALINYKYIKVKVPQGAEHYWADVLRKEPILSQATVNCLYEL
ncbi:MAG TPA: hypothetical protein VNS58_28455 [Puia sp.]|nr:hypothetical protein [Puia sp.]